MSTLGVVTCEVLEREVAELLAADREVVRIAVVADRRAARLVEELEARGAPALERLPHVRAFRPEPGAGLEVVVRVLGIALHRRGALLRRALGDAVAELAPRVDGLCLAYGRCGGALDGFLELLGGEKPAAVPEDGGVAVEDCVALLLGGLEPYRRAQREVPGTFFVTPGWAHHWRGAFGAAGPARSAHVRRVFARYERALLVVPPGAREQVLRGEVEELRSALGLRVETCAGTTALLAGAWERAKRGVRRAQEVRCS